MKNTYWNRKGKLQNTYNKLQDMIPHTGSVVNQKVNKRLETLRIASNCYYDLFNNGLCNRAKEFRKVFGFPGTPIVKGHYKDLDQLEKRMNHIIIEAAIEQGLID